MKPAQRRKKGQRFERMLAKDIEAEGLGKAGREAMSGGGYRKGDIASSLKYIIEAKNQKVIHFLNWVDQTKEEARVGNNWPEKWILAIRDPRTPETQTEIYAVMDWYELLKLLKKESEPRVKEPDRQLTWDIKALINTCKKILKQ